MGTTLKRLKPLMKRGTNPSNHLSTCLTLSTLTSSLKQKGLLSSWKLSKYLSYLLDQVLMPFHFGHLVHQLQKYGPKQIQRQSYLE